MPRITVQSRKAMLESLKRGNYPEFERHMAVALLRELTQLSDYPTNGQITSVLVQVDRILGNFGVETMTLKDRRNGYIYIEYSNAGDTYNTTILTVRRGNHVRIEAACWGDYAERYREVNNDELYSMR